MTPKKRVNIAMDLGVPDKTPLMCQLSIGHMLLQADVSPAEFWLDPKIYTDTIIELRRVYDFDGILISLYGHNPNWRADVAEIKKGEDNETVYFKNGNKLICPYNDLPYYEFKNPKEEFDLVDIKNIKLPNQLDYYPVSQNLPFYINNNHKFDVIDEVIKREGEKYSIHGEITSPFDYFLDLIGTQNGLMGLIDQPDNSKFIINHFTKLIKDFAIDMCNTGVDAIKISSPFAGAGFISPDDYKEFVYPFESEIVKSIRDNKVHVYIHTCGAIDDRLELMFDSGASGIECLDPAPLGNVELSDAVQRIGNKGFIKGNIDSVNTLLNGDKELIYNDAKNRLLIGKKKNGFILSTACSIAPGVKRENIQILRKVIEEWG